MNTENLRDLEKDLKRVANKYNMRIDVYVDPHHNLIRVLMRKDSKGGQNNVKKH